MAFEGKEKESKHHKPKKKHYYTGISQVDDGFEDFDEEIYYDSRTEKGQRKPKKKRSHFEY